MDVSYRRGIIISSCRTSTVVATLGLFFTLGTLLSHVQGTHPYPNSMPYGNQNCAFMSPCEVTDVLMQEINALKEKLAELVNFQVDVNQFKFEHGIHRSQMDQFREHVELFMKSHNPETQPIRGAVIHGNDVPGTTHADAPNHQPINDKDSMSLPAIHNRLEQVEHAVRQWDENVLSSTRNGETLRQTLEREEGTRKVLEEKIGHLQKKMDDIQTQLREEKDKSETMKNELWDLKQATNKHETALGRQQDVVQNVNRTLGARVNALEESMGYFSSDLFQLSYRGDEFQENITRDVETIKKTTNSRFANATGHIDRLTSQLTYVVSDLQNITKEVGFINGDVNEVKMQVETFVDRMFTFDMLFTKHNRELQSVLKSVHETNSTMQRVWQTMGSAAEDIENLKSDVTNWEEALVAFNASVATNNQEIETLWQISEANLTEMRKLVHRTDQSVDDFRTSIAIDVRRLISHHDDMEKRMDAAESSHKWTENEVKAYEIQAGKYESEIEYLRQQNSANSANVKVLRHDVKMLQNSLDAVRKYQTELKANVSDMMQILFPLVSTTPSVIVTDTVTETETEATEFEYENETTMAVPTEESGFIEDEVVAEPLTMLGEEPTFSGCLFVPLVHPNIVTSIRGRPINNWLTEVKEGEEIAHHCEDIGAFRIEGDTQRTCLANGVWSGRQPICHQLTTVERLVAGARLNVSAPPAIEISPKPESLTTGITPNGSLVVTPGSRLVLSCIFHRSYGKLTWTFTPSSGTRDLVLAGHWTQDIRNEIKMQNARVDQSGRYTCTNGKGGQHSIHVIVRDIQCSVPPEDPLLHVKDPVKLRLNSVLNFGCKKLGYDLYFPDAENFNSTSAADDVSDHPAEKDFRCLASGEWSRDFPTCIRKFERGG